MIIIIIKKNKKIKNYNNNNNNNSNINILKTVRASAEMYIKCSRVTYLDVDILHRMTPLRMLYSWTSCYIWQHLVQKYIWMIFIDGDNCNIMTSLGKLYSLTLTNIFEVIWNDDTSKTVRSNAQVHSVIHEIFAIERHHYFCCNLLPWNLFQGNRLQQK